MVSLISSDTKDTMIGNRIFGRRNGPDGLPGVLVDISGYRKILRDMGPEEGIVERGIRALEKGRTHDEEAQRFAEISMLYDTIAMLCDSVEPHWNGAPQSLKDRYRRLGRFSAQKGEELRGLYEDTVMGRREPAQRVPDRTKTGTVYIFANDACNSSLDRTAYVFQKDGQYITVENEDNTGLGPLSEGSMEWYLKSKGLSVEALKEYVSGAEVRWEVPDDFSQTAYRGLHFVEMNFLRNLLEIG